jgi:hypothetical protein
LGALTWQLHAEKTGGEAGKNYSCEKGRWDVSNVTEVEKVDWMLDLARERDLRSSWALPTGLDVGSFINGKTGLNSSQI